MTKKHPFHISVLARRTEAALPLSADIPKQIEGAGAPDAREPRGVYVLYSSTASDADGRRNFNLFEYTPKQIEGAGAPDAREPRGVYVLYSSLGQATQMVAGTSIYSSSCQPRSKAQPHDPSYR